MARSMHDLDPLPPPPPNARPARATPRISSCVTHLVSAAVMYNGWVGLKGLNRPIAGNFEVLRHGAMWQAVVTALLAALSDVLPGVEILRKAKRGVMWPAMAFGVTVSVIYWTLMFLAPDLILPSASGSSPNQLHIPRWVDISINLFPSLYLLADYYLTERSSESSNSGKRGDLPSNPSSNNRRRSGYTPRWRKRAYVVIGVVGFVWFGRKMLGFGREDRPKIIYAERYNDEFKYRPAASPVITEHLPNGQIRLRGASPAGVGIRAGDLPKTPREREAGKKAKEKKALEDAKRQLGMGGGKDERSMKQKMKDEKRNPGRNGKKNGM